MLQEYHILRKAYRTLIKHRIGKYMEKEAAEKDPFQAIRPRQPLFPNSIPIGIWESQTKKVIAQKDTRPEFTGGHLEKEPSPYFTRAEVEKAIILLKSNKDPGVGGICNEIWRETHPILGEDGWFYSIHA
jgi:hypothetical protein